LLNVLVFAILDGTIQAVRSGSAHASSGLRVLQRVGSGQSLCRA